MAEETQVKERTPDQVSELLAAWNAGERGADERVFELVYEELKRIASNRMRGEGSGHSLQTTALVHEAYLRLAAQQQPNWKNRGHFFALAAQAMRRILVDHARRRRAAKRGGGVTPSPLDSIAATIEATVDLLALDTALGKLERLDPRGAQVVELRFFAGLSVSDVAVTLGTSVATVERDWTAARTWLRRELGSAEGSGGR